MGHSARDEIVDSFNRLRSYCESKDFKGYDPYDGLNSKLFQAIPLLPKNALARLAWIQFFKRFPWNMRKWVGIPEDYNPKALGLFLTSYCQLDAMVDSTQLRARLRYFIDRILERTSKGYHGACWGYNFAWQARAFYHPKYSPTVVASTFVANALLDAFEITHDAELLETARSTCDFILKDLNRHYDPQGKNFAFSYSPTDTSVIYNASLLGSKLLSRVYSYTGEAELLDEAHRSVAFCCERQLEDGSWVYGTYDWHQWIDSFHTGYNLECISDYCKYGGDASFRNHLDSGFKFYLDNFFTDEGAPKYYNNALYPIDIHSPAQFVITLIRMGKFEEHRDLVDRVLLWTIRNMQSREGYFSYQIKRFSKCNIPYMRWGQAWMMYALSHWHAQVSKEDIPILS